MKYRLAENALGEFRIQERRFIRWKFVPYTEWGDRASAMRSVKAHIDADVRSAQRIKKERLRQTVVAATKQIGCVCDDHK